MKRTSKIIVTAIMVVIFIALFGVLTGVTTDRGDTPGILGIILLAGLIGGITAVCKKRKE